MADDDDNTESVLVMIRECFVYKIPTRGPAGYKAGEWNVEQFLWSGKLVVVSLGEKCTIRLEDPKTGEVFATCPYTEGAVETVNDSSRYFVLRIDDGRGRHAFIGMGFTERDEAFNFSAALQDHKKYVKQRKDAIASEKALANAPKLDLSLKDGQKIHVNVNVKKPTASTTKSGAPSLFSSDGKLAPPPGSKLAPPPSASKPASSSSSSNAFSSSSSDDFDSFFSAPASNTATSKPASSGSSGSLLDDDFFGGSSKPTPSANASNTFDWSSFQ